MILTFFTGYPFALLSLSPATTLNRYTGKGGSRLTTDDDTISVSRLDMWYKHPLTQLVSEVVVSFEYFHHVI